MYNGGLIASWNLGRASESVDGLDLAEQCTSTKTTDERIVCIDCNEHKT
jgi:hypothetical protein